MRTCTIMIFTDGTRTRYGVFRGPMLDARTFGAHKAELVGIYERTMGQGDYRKMTARYATPDAPPVYWQA